MGLPTVGEGGFTNTEVVTLDAGESRSVVNLVPAVVKEAIEQWAFERPELFGQDERELYAALRSDGKTPSPTDNRLRLKFWMEYDRVQAEGLKAMSMVNVLAGVCSREMFYGNYLRHASKVAWMLCPPTGYQLKAEEALEFGLDQLRDLLEMPHAKRDEFVDEETGVTTYGPWKVDTKLGELKAKIVAMLDNRVRGAVVQKTMNLNMNSGVADVAKMATAGTAEDLMKQLKELDRQTRRAKNLPDVDGKTGQVEVS